MKRMRTIHVFGGFNFHKKLFRVDMFRKRKLNKNAMNELIRVQLSDFKWEENKKWRRSSRFWDNCSCVQVSGNSINAKFIPTSSHAARHRCTGKLSYLSSSCGRKLKSRDESQRGSQQQKAQSWSHSGRRKERVDCERRLTKTLNSGSQRPPLFLLEWYQLAPYRLRPFRKCVTSFEWQKAVNNAGKLIMWTKTWVGIGWKFVVILLDGRQCRVKALVAHCSCPTLTPYVQKHSSALGQLQQITFVTLFPFFMAQSSPPAAGSLAEGLVAILGPVVEECDSNIKAVSFSHPPFSVPLCLWIPGL